MSETAKQKESTQTTKEETRIPTSPSTAASVNSEERKEKQKEENTTQEQQVLLFPPRNLSLTPEMLRREAEIRRIPVEGELLSSLKRLRIDETPASEDDDEKCYSTTTTTTSLPSSLTQLHAKQQKREPSKQTSTAKSKTTEKQKAQTDGDDIVIQEYEDEVVFLMDHVEIDESKHPCPFMPYIY